MVKIRLTRVGAKKRPFYRIQAIDQRKPRGGRPLEFLGTYDPGRTPELIEMRRDAVDAWLAKGAQMSDTVASLYRRSAAAGAAAAPDGASSNG